MALISSVLSRKQGTSITLTFRPHNRLVSNTSRYILHFYDAVLDDPDATSRVALAAHELLENTVKYSSDGISHVEIQLMTQAEQSFVQITIRNRALPDQLAGLCRILDEIRASTDPLALYYEFIARSADQEEGSGLGLVRIRAEAEMELRYSIDVDQVTIVAETPVKLAAGSANSAPAPIEDAP